MFCYKKNRQSGRSMIEMLGVLAIVGVLSAGGIAGYSMAMQSYKTNQLIERINLIVTRVRTVYKNGEYTGLSRDAMSNSGKLSTKDMENPFGGDLSLGVSGGLGSKYFVVAGTMPSEACTDVVHTYWGDKGVFWGITNITPQFTYSGGTYPATDMASVLSACSGGNPQEP